MLETKNNLNDDTVDGLRKLIRHNNDSAEAFESVAQKLKSSALATYFRQEAREHERFARQLGQFIELSAEKAPETGTAGGTLRKWWLEIRGTIEGGDEHAMLAEAERGADVIRDAYEEVLRETAGNPVNDTLLKQYAHIKSSHDQIRDMRDARE